MPTIEYALLRTLAIARHRVVGEKVWLVGNDLRLWYNFPRLVYASPTRVTPQKRSCGVGDRTPFLPFLPSRQGKIVGIFHLLTETLWLLRRVVAWIKSQAATATFAKNTTPTIYVSRCCSKQSELGKPSIGLAQKLPT